MREKRDRVKPPQLKAIQVQRENLKLINCPQLQFSAETRSVHFITGVSRSSILLASCSSTAYALPKYDHN
ncbi:hypothetical protein T01_2474 [Trichinella spiralis]|uniref:Uncharacterized protein n=1 Tax=Trichinella spiralis TaxID=6334 RepID=A0A0V1AYG6_TRISP|nr:hypothetical protein T01_2474 [Trichinella spiralis]